MSPFLPAWTPGTLELLAVLGVAVLLFGAKKIPELARGLGRSVKEFKKGVNEGEPEGSGGGEGGEGGKPPAGPPGAEKGPGAPPEPGKEASRQ